MKREIKFRAWDKKFKIMLDSSYGDWISFDGVTYSEAETKYNTPHIEIERADDYEVMEFTGIQDKNGVDIYEGDILRGENDIYGRDCVEMTDACVYFCEGSFGILLLYDSYFVPFIDTEETWEVIGNIYKNPELIIKNSDDEKEI